MSETLSEIKQKQSGVVLSNLTDIVVGVISEIAGNDLANTIEGERATKEMLRALVVQRCSFKINNDLKHI